MKTIITTALLILIIGNIGAVDIESYQFIDYLRAISAPGKPDIYEDGVVFTAPDSYQRVGISFAHEGYAKIHWFMRLMIPRDNVEVIEAAKNKKPIDPNKASGILFHVQTIPWDLKNMDYRIVIDGLWTTDPYNPVTVTGPSGIMESRVQLPEKPKNFIPPDKPGTYQFSFQGPPGETITVGGNFNNWDPFMYVLQEIRPGFYTLTLSLPPGSFQYVFFYRGEQIPDEAKIKRLYTRDGRIISEGIVN